VDIKEIGESGLIQRIADTCQSSHSSVIAGIGDDAAALKLSNHTILLTTSDLLIEDIHFDLRFTNSYLLGRKALAVNLSDIAAMGGTPRFFVVSLALPVHFSLSFVDDLYRGMMEVASHFSTILVGGDTNASPQKLMISITVLGEGYPDHICLRGGAQTGDSLFVTGTLGDAALGLVSLQKDPARYGQSPLNPLVAKHLSPHPRIREGKVLADNHFASSLIDVSDGLLTDLSRILKASKKGATVKIENLPLSNEFKEFESPQSFNKINYALTGGEDYELLFTCAPEKEEALLQSAHGEGFAITNIGTITDSEELLLLDHNQQPYPLDTLGYDHFHDKM
jgi:thiamine-monophosphate kinase